MFEKGRESTATILKKTMACWLLGSAMVRGEVVGDKVKVLPMPRKRKSVIVTSAFLLLSCACVYII